MERSPGPFRTFEPGPLGQLSQPLRVQRWFGLQG